MAEPLTFRPIEDGDELFAGVVCVDFAGGHVRGDVVDTFPVNCRAVRAVDPDTYFYGEAWNFGEVADGALFEQASQLNIGGTEIGSFNESNVIFFFIESHVLSGLSFCELD